MLKQRARDRLYKRAVGFLVLASVLVLLFVLRMYQQAAGPFDDSIHIHAVTPRADGIEIDSPVTMVGIKIGRVIGINVTEDRKVDLELEIQGQYKVKVRGDSKATLSKPIIGSAFIDITIGSPEQAALKTGAMVDLVRLPDLNDVVAELPSKLQKVDTVLGNVIAATEEVKTLAKKVSADGGALDNSLKNVEKITKEAAESAGKVNQTLTKVQPAVDDALKATKQVNAILDDVKTGTARVDGMTQKTDAILVNAEGMSRDLRGVTPQIVPVLNATQDVLSEADDVLRSAKNSVLLRESTPPAAPGPLPASSR